MVTGWRDPLRGSAEVGESDRVWGEGRNGEGGGDVGLDSHHWGLGSRRHCDLPLGTLDRTGTPAFRPLAREAGTPRIAEDSARRFP